MYGSSSFSKREMRVADNQPGLRQVHDVSDVAVVAPFQLRERQVMWFERPQEDVRPNGKDADQAGLVVVRVVGDGDMVNVDPVLPLEWRTLARQSGDALGRLGRNHSEHVQVRRFSGEPVVLADDESADAVEVGEAVESSVEVR